MAHPFCKERGGTVTIGFIGAGKVGFTLGKFFTQGSIPVTGYYSRHGESAQAAARFTGTKAFEEIGDLVRESDTLFLTVPDGEITSVYREVAAFGIAGKQICHCSGASTARELFPGIEEAGAYGYSIHPLFPVSSKLTSYQELPDAFFCLEGTGPHLPEWEARLRALGPKVRVIAPEGKIRYHAACAIASNLVCALVDESVALLKTCGFSEQEALQALAPLMRSNLEHLIADGPVKALTGPVERGDAGTVRRHLAALDTEAEKAMYRAVSLRLADVAARSNPGRDYEPVRNALLGD